MMTADEEKETRRAAALLQAERLRLTLPEPAIAGVIANLDLLAGHYRVLSDALARAAEQA